MSSASLNIRVVERRMLSTSDAAEYTGIPKKYFKTTCPVRPIEVRPGTEVYDKRDLDIWLDELKLGTETSSQDAILSKL